MRLIAAHFGLTYTSTLRTLPDGNSDDFPGKVKQITCATRDTLRDFFQPTHDYLVKLVGYAVAAFEEEPCVDGDDEVVVEGDAAADGGVRARARKATGQQRAAGSILTPPHASPVP